MRNLIPQIQISVARDRQRANRVIAELVLGQEVFLTRLTDDLLKVTDSNDPNTARVLGVVFAEWSDRIVAAETSGRQCRAWYVGELPLEKSVDGTYRILLTVWCSTSGQTGWREIGVEELLRTARVHFDMPIRSRRQRRPVFNSRIHETGTQSQPLAAHDYGSVNAVGKSGPIAMGTSTSALQTEGAILSAEDTSGAALSVQRISLIKDAVLRKFDKLKSE
ncbi:hypothetical protein [Paragemmobacter aquarius]|uniref:hypothetical protein n=1 Tax=Paragemmobacter aquarius TaxID=2169400 RepID=UPI00131EEEA2|nr:hypothetical protein [Gemmobacter aquarius]